MSKTLKQRGHILSAKCWCGPVVHKVRAAKPKTVKAAG